MADAVALRFFHVCMLFKQFFLLFIHVFVRFWLSFFVIFFILLTILAMLKSTVQCLVVKFVTSGSVNNQLTSVRQRYARLVENIVVISVGEPEVQDAQEVGISFPNWFNLHDSTDPTGWRYMSHSERRCNISPPLSKNLIFVCYIYKKDEEEGKKIKKIRQLYYV